jgi:pimeloyl-ACP methyl ester carboxylesterase
MERHVDNIFLNTLIMNNTQQKLDQEKPPIVLVHGFAGGIGYWKLSLDTLAQYYRVYAFDLPGFGLSSRVSLEKLGVSSPEEAEKFLVRSFEEWKKSPEVGLGDEKVHLVGHSFGGWISACIAMHCPSHVRQLTLCDPWGVPQHPDWLRKPILSMVAKSVAHRLKHQAQMTAAAASAASASLRSSSSSASLATSPPSPLTVGESPRLSRSYSNFSDTSSPVTSPKIVPESPLSATEPIMTPQAATIMKQAAEAANIAASETQMLADAVNAAAVSHDPELEMPLAELLGRTVIRAMSANSLSALSLLRLAGRTVGMRALGVVTKDIHERYYSSTMSPEFDKAPDASPVLQYLYETNTISPPLGELLFKKLYSEDLDIEWACRPLGPRLSQIPAHIPTLFIYGSESWLRQIQDGVAAAKTMPGPVQVRVCPGGHQVFADDADAFHAALFDDHARGEFREVYAHPGETDHTHEE